MGANPHYGGDVTQLDADGQPPRAFYQRRVEDRLVAELLGVCKGMVVDGAVTEGEAQGLRRWMVGHPLAIAGYPGRVLAERLQDIFADGYVSPEEREELGALLLDLTGETPAHDEPLNRTAVDFLDAPPPTVIFDGQEFVFTGRMLYASRAECEQQVRDRGGRAAARVTKRTNYLVVGPIGSEAWIQTTHGEKLLHAANLRAKGSPIHIVAEDHWLQAVAETG